MTPEDYAQLQAIAWQVKGLSNVGVLSPIREGERKLFPKAKALSRRQWDLNQPGKRDFDLLIASNVFMYSPTPQRWFDNVLASCAYFILLDLVRRRRGDDGELGPDGDCMRYAIGEERPRISRFFDLAGLDDRLLGYRTYYGGANEVDDSPLHVIAVLRGFNRCVHPACDLAISGVVASLAA